MPIADYFDAANLGEIHEFSGKVSAEYREDHDENNTKFETAINALDGRAAVLEDETTSVINSLSTANATVERISVNDFFAVSRVTDALVNGLSDSNVRVLTKSVDDVVGDFLPSRWPGWMINKDMVDIAKDVHRVGVPVLWGASSVPAAGIYRKAGAVVGDELLYQRLDTHYPIQNLRGATFTIVCEYICEVEVLFELFAQYGPTGGAHVRVNSGTNDSGGTDAVQQTVFQFTVDEDADYVTVGLDFEKGTVGGNVEILNCMVLLGARQATPPAVGTSQRQRFNTDLEGANIYWRRFSSSYYGESQTMTIGAGSTKGCELTANFNQPLVMRESDDEVLFDAAVIIEDASFTLVSGPTLSVRDPRNHLGGAIDFTSVAPFDAVEQDQSAHHNGGDYKLGAAAHAFYELTANSASLFNNMPVAIFTGEVFVVPPFQL